MKTKTQGRFGRTTRLENGRRDVERAAEAVPANRPINNLETLKRRLLEQQLAAVTDGELIRRLQRAADDSASLAWATPFPLLALPELLSEKAREARRQFERQRAILSGRTAITSLAA